MKQPARRNQRSLSVLVVITVVLLGIARLVTTPTTRSVLVAGQPLKRGTIVNRQHLENRQVRADLVPGGAVGVDDLADVVGQHLDRLVGAGEVLTWTSFVGADHRLSGLIRPEHRLVFLPVDDSSPLKTYLETDDRIDLLWVPAAKPEYTYTLLDNIAVFRTLRRGAQVLLALHLPRDHALRLQHAMDRGRIRIMLRRPHHTPRPAEAPPEPVVTSKLLQSLRGGDGDGVEIVFGQNNAEND